MLEETEIRELIDEITGITFVIGGNDYLFQVHRDWTHVNLRNFVSGKEKEVRKIVIQNSPVELGGDDFVGYTIGWTDDFLPKKGRKRFISMTINSLASDVPGLVDGRLLARGVLEYLRPNIFNGTVWGSILSEHSASVYPARGGSIIETTKVINVEMVYSFQMTIILRDTIEWTVNEDTVAPLAKIVEVGVRGSAWEPYSYVKIVH